jgi:hypothetical protein
MIFAGLIRIPLIVSGLLTAAATASDIPWWHTDAGDVVEHLDRDGVNCTLTLKSDHGQFEFAWNNKLPPRAIVERKVWQFPASYMWMVSLRIGNTWLGGGDGTPNIPALTGSDRLMFLLDQPIDGLLLSAHDIALRTPDRTFEIDLAADKIHALVAALRKCTAYIGHK